MASGLTQLVRGSQRHLSITKTAWNRLGIVDAGFCRGQSKLGVDKGPALIKAAGLKDELSDSFPDISEYDQLKFETLVREDKNYPNVRKGNFRANQPNAVAAASKTIAGWTYRASRENDCTLVLGGDHSMAIGTLLGHKMAHEDDFCVLWIDAHGDINTPRTSGSGNLHGQVLSYLVKELENEHLPTAFDRHWCRAFLPASRLAYIGLRDVDSGEHDILERLNISRVCMQQIRRYLIYAHTTKKHHMKWVLDKCLQQINPNGDLPMHISFDVDSLDPFFAPATGTASPDGLTMKDVEYIGKELARRNINIRVLDLAEVNPLETNNCNASDATVTARSAVKVAGYLLNPQMKNYQQ